MEYGCLESDESESRNADRNVAQRSDCSTPSESTPSRILRVGRSAATWAPRLMIVLLTDIGTVPCSRQALLSGIVGGVGIGGITFISRRSE